MNDKNLLNYLVTLLNAYTECKSNQQILFILGSIAIFAIQNRTMADLTQEEWTKKLSEDSNAVILDVRTPEEIEEGIIKDAMHIDIYTGQAFVDALQKLDKSKNYYVYCRSGNRSGQACAIMNSLGFDHAYNLQGGILEWEGDLS